VITYYDRRISLLYLVKVSYIYIIYIFLKNMHSRSYSKQPSICNQLKILFHFTTFLSFLKQPCTFTMHRHQRDHFVQYCKCLKDTQLLLLHYILGFSYIQTYLKHWKHAIFTTLQFNVTIISESSHKLDFDIVIQQHKSWSSKFKM